MSGPELSRRISEERPDIEVLFISGHPEGLDGSDITEFDDRLLRKPFRRRELLGEVSKILPGRGNPPS
jgi:CheY-like chemotaxis protein